MYETLLRSAGYAGEMAKSIWGAVTHFFAPGQFGFLIILFAACLAAGKYGRRALQKRCLYRPARLFSLVMHGCCAVLVCFAAYQVIQTIYPLVVKAVSTFK